MNTPPRRFRLGILAILLLSPVLIVPALDAGEVSATLGVDSTRRAGTDGAGRVLLFTPNPLQSGSSVSHWDTSAFPNLLMEPSSGSLGFAQLDLTVPQMEDIGWPRGGSNLVLRVQDPPGQGFNNPCRLSGPIRRNDAQSVAAMAVSRGWFDEVCQQSNRLPTSF